MTDISLRANTSGRPFWLWPVMATMLIIGWSSGFVGIRFANEEASVFLLLFWRTLLSGVILLPFALAFGPPMTLRSILSQAAFGVVSVFLYLGGFALAIEQRVPTGLVALINFAIAMAWLVLIATFATYSVYYTSLRLFPVAKVSAAIYLSPPVTMVWAWVLFSEPLTLPMFLGLAVTLVGVMLTSRN